MMSLPPILEQVNPQLSRWFRLKFHHATEIQRLSWPIIAAGEHVLLTAPTGSGKTLTAFLWALNQLISGEWSPGKTRVLYISPLKALNNDIRRNLTGPLEEIRSMFDQEQQPIPIIRVMTRSGDTPQTDRRRMLRHPPEILITTPESLNLMLSSKGGRAILQGIKTVILDEIHAVFGNKRGVYLMTAVDRLVPLNGEFQRIALSATINPIESVARFIGGWEMSADGGNPRYRRRCVSVLKSGSTKKFEVRVRLPETVLNRSAQESIWEPMAAAFSETIRNNRSTLLFTNSRRLCEKLTFLINRGRTEPLAYSHHGSLSREIRHEVEHKLKTGGLKAIVATNSLEMGIDIGALDEVLLVQSPNAVSSAVQRIGRAGHQVGAVSRGTFHPSHAHDILLAAVIAKAVVEADIETVSAVKKPLDVLAQVIVSMVSVETWDMDDLFAAVKCTDSYHDLDRTEFDLVLNMLAGQYAETRIRELNPRIAIDRLDNTVMARKGAQMAIYLSGGVIPDRGYFQLRHHQTQAKIGELDEEFVWEAKQGQVFTFGTQNWKIEKITHNDVWVRPAKGGKMAPPFWIAEDNARDFHFSQKIGAFLEEADEMLDHPQYISRLITAYHLDTHAAGELRDYLIRQRNHTRTALPHRRHLLVEWTHAGPGGAPGSQMILHTLWGGRVNRPLALAMDAAWEEIYGIKAEVFATDECIVLQLPRKIESGRILTLITADNIDDYLRKRLESSGFFGARFRENCGRALLLTRRKINERMPLWMNRLRAQKLMASVLKFEDFPILLETWRSVLQDEFDMESLRRVLSALSTGTIRYSEIHTAYPSPMAMGGAWRQINQYMYMDDSGPSRQTSKLRDDLLQQVVFTPGLRPAVSREMIDRFEQKRRRMAPGYAPNTPLELLEWVKERLLITWEEWKDLMAAIQKDHAADPNALQEMLKDRIVKVIPPKGESGREIPLVASIELLPRLIHVLWRRRRKKVQWEPLEEMETQPIDVSLIGGGDTHTEDDDDPAMPADILGQWLSYFGPVTEAFIADTLGMDAAMVKTVIGEMCQTKSLIRGALIKEQDSEFICDSENFEILLRMTRSTRELSIEPQPMEKLPQFLASWQGITAPGNLKSDLLDVMEQLIGFPAPAGLWESEILPARLSSYDPAWLDALMQESGILWIGDDKKRIAFSYPEDLDLLTADLETSGDEAQEAVGDNGGREEASAKGRPVLCGDLFPENTGGRYDFISLKRRSGLDDRQLWARIWEGVWRREVTNDSFSAVRRGVTGRFSLKNTPTPVSAVKSGRRRRFRRITAQQPVPGNPMPGSWYLLSIPDAPQDRIELEELRKDRVRMLLDRYGILFRELMTRESSAFQWPVLFRTLRLMELSGEVIGGYFFLHLPGPQFVSREGLRHLRRRFSDDAIYWLNAMDPAALCGCGLRGFGKQLPQRIAGNHLVYHGATLVMISRRMGKQLHILVDDKNNNLNKYYGVLLNLLTRNFNPMKQIVIERINGVAAARSPYIEAMKSLFDVIVDYKKVILYKKIP